MERENIIKILTEKHVNLPCPRCANKNFNVLDGYFNDPVQTDPSSYNIGGLTIPTVVTICNNCGFISQHALGALGLLLEEGPNEGDEKSPKEEAQI